MQKHIENLEIAKVSSKGQLVIPQDIRIKLGIKEGNLFAVASVDNLLVLKKIESPVNEADMRTLKMVEDAWDDIKEGRYSVASLDEFEKQAEKW